MIPREMHITHLTLECVESDPQRDVIPSINLSHSESAVAELEKNFIAAIESTYTQDVEGLESLLEAFGSQFHPRHYLVLIVKWLLVVQMDNIMHDLQEEAGDDLFQLVLVWIKIAV